MLPPTCWRGQSSSGFKHPDRLVGLLDLSPKDPDPWLRVLMMNPPTKRILIPHTARRASPRNIPVHLLATVSRAYPRFNSILCCDHISKLRPPFIRLVTSEGSLTLPPTSCFCSYPDQHCLTFLFISDINDSEETHRRLGRSSSGKTQIPNFW